MSLHEPLPPGCNPHCHGCRHRSLDVAASRAQKQDHLRRVLRPWHDRIAELRGVADDERLGYRERVTLSARWSTEAGWRFGLMRRDELIPIHDCPVHAPRVNALVHRLVETLPPGPVLPLAYLHVCGGQAVLIVKARDVDAASLDRTLQSVGAAGLEGLWLHCHPSAGRRLFARSGWTLLWGEPRSRDPDGLVHGPTAFRQALPSLHALALDAAQRHLAPGRGVAVLDLYCGGGSGLRRWTAAGAAVLGVELSGEAVASALDNAPGARVLRGTCAQRLPQVRDWWGRQDGERVAYLNPPRSGLEPEVCASLAHELQPQRIAYLSCSAGTLARDLALLEQAHYRLRAIEPYDFFPLTHHVEALALLERAS